MIFFVYSIFSWLKIQLSTPKFTLQLILSSIWSSIKSDHAILLLLIIFQWPSITLRIKSKHFASPVLCHITNNHQYSGSKYAFLSHNSDGWLGGFSNDLIWPHSCSYSQLGEDVQTSSLCVWDCGPGFFPKLASHLSTALWTEGDTIPWKPSL